MLRIRPATGSDADDLYRICLLTGDAGADATKLYTDPTLLGDIYVGPYLRFDPALCLVAETPDQVFGYVVGTDDTRAFETACELTWWPAMRARHPSDAARPAPDAALVEKVHRPSTTAPEILDGFPAHLHINLLPSAQGRGLGRTMLEAFFTLLEERGVAGVHLGVDPRNVAAKAFYERIGFTSIGADLFGMALSARP